jgi:PBP1b-binding outer membrane lipoprotein LpoB
LYSVNFMTLTRQQIHGLVPGLAFILAVLLGGCATAPPPLTELADAKAAMAAAREADAETHAPVELRVAQDKLTRAEAAQNEKNYKLAGALARHAIVDAEFAVAKSRQAQARAAARMQDETNRKLRRDLLGEGGTP